MGRRGLAIALWAATLALTGLVPVGSAEAREGFLDRGFGDDGTLVAPAPVPGASWIKDVGGGSFLLAWGDTFARLGPDGAVDQGFGAGGTLTLPSDIEGLNLGIYDWELDGQGRIVAFGTATESTPVINTGLYSVSRSWAVVMRYTASGQVDTSFGEGKGFVRSDYGATPEPRGADGEDYGIPGATSLDLEIDAAGRPLLLVGHEAVRSPCYGHSGYEWFPYAVVRLTETGGLDPSFGEGGLRRVAGISSYPRPHLLLGAEEQILVAGSEGDACPRAGLILELDHNGSATGSYRRYPGRYFAALAPDGGIVFRHRLIGLGALSRSLPNGALDAGFGTKGRVRVEPPLGARTEMDAIRVDSEGRILLGCTFTLPPPGQKPRTKAKPRRTFFAVTRLRGDGKRDRGFGRRGWIVTKVPPGSSLSEFDLDSAGRLLVGLGHGRGEARTGSFRRYLLD